MFQKTVLNAVSSFLPDILKRYLQPEEIDQIMAEVEDYRYSQKSLKEEEYSICFMYIAYW